MAEGKRLTFSSVFSKFDYCLTKICQKFTYQEECYGKFADVCAKLASGDLFIEDPYLGDDERK